MEKERKCGVCKGSGNRICYSCRGKGSKVKQNPAYIPIYGCPLPEIEVCPTCHGTGKILCPYCHGTGCK